jgi:hypothetical protein
MLVGGLQVTWDFLYIIILQKMLIESRTSFKVAFHSSVKVICN